LPRRFFRHGELPLVLLVLLAERPRHGYEILAELKRLFGPRYRPSPGSVYPAIEALYGEGLIDGQTDDAKTTYRITPAGEQAIEARRDALAALEVRTGARFGDADSIEPLLGRFRARLLPLSGRVDPQAIAAILQRAAADIESLDGLSRTEEAN
jgi:DNA-binding PadR family transcriptional regulator